MTDPDTRIRDVALALPETEERPSHGQPTFFVAAPRSDRPPDEVEAPFGEVQADVAVDVAVKADLPLGHAAFRKVRGL